MCLTSNCLHALTRNTLGDPPISVYAPGFPVSYVFSTVLTKSWVDLRRMKSFPARQFSAFCSLWLSLKNPSIPLIACRFSWSLTWVYLWIVSSEACLERDMAVLRLTLGFFSNQEQKVCLRLCRTILCRLSWTPSLIPSLSTMRRNAMGEAVPARAKIGGSHFVVGISHLDSTSA